MIPGLAHGFIGDLFKAERAPGFDDELDFPVCFLCQGFECRFEMAGMGSSGQDNGRCWMFWSILVLTYRDFVGTGFLSWKLGTVAVKIFRLVCLNVLYGREDVSLWRLAVHRSHGCAWVQLGIKITVCGVY